MNPIWVEFIHNRKPKLNALLVLYHHPTLLSSINSIPWNSISRILRYAGINLGIFNLMSIQWNWSHRHVDSILIGPKSSLFHGIRPNPRSSWLKSEIEHKYSRDLEIKDSTTMHPYSLIESYRNSPTSSPWEKSEIWKASELKNWIRIWIALAE